MWQTLLVTQRVFPYFLHSFRQCVRHILYQKQRLRHFLPRLCVNKKRVTGLGEGAWEHQWDGDQGWREDGAWGEWAPDWEGKGRGPRTVRERVKAKGESQPNSRDPDMPLLWSGRQKKSDQLHRFPLSCPRRSFFGCSEHHVRTKAGGLQCSVSESVIPSESKKKGVRLASAMATPSRCVGKREREKQAEIARGRYVTVKKHSHLPCAIVTGPRRGGVTLRTLVGDSFSQFCVTWLRPS